MKIQTIFDLLGASQDLLSFFDGVETPSQVVSRLETLKRGDVVGMLDDLNSLRMSVTATFSDTIELGGSLSSEEEGSDDIESALSDFPDLDLSESPPTKDAEGKAQPAGQVESAEKATSS